MTSENTRIFNNVLASYRDNNWLISNEQMLFDAIQDDLRNADNPHTAIQCLLLVFPRMFELQSKEVKSWGKLVREAFNRYVSQEDDYVFANPHDNSINGIYVVQMRESPSQLPTKTRRKKREIVHPQAFYEMYLSLLMTYFYEKHITITAEIMHDMVILARAVNDPYLANKTYQTLAYIHNAYGNYEQARTFAEKAWDFWVASPAPLESFLTAYALHVANSGLGDEEQATHWRKILSQIHDPENQFGHQAILAHLKSRS